MNAHTVTLELPPHIYQRANQAALATHRPIERVLVEWLESPYEENRNIANLETLTDEEVIRIAKSTTPPTVMHRLQELLFLQQQRALTDLEHKEAAFLVEQEDLLTLQKARAIFLLKQRRILLDELIKQPL